MNHEEALREMSVEKYLLGELTGTARDTFEDHLFDCQLCAADLKSGMTFAQAAREELLAEAPVRSVRSEKTRGWFDWLLRPQWMAPALGACLLLIGYQNGVLLPALQHQVTDGKTPHIVNTLAMSSGAVRGESLLHVAAPEKGAFVLQADLPPRSSQYASYVCSLYSPAGVLVWQGSVPLSQAGETISISVPSSSTQAGRNTLVVQGVRTGAAAGATLDDLTKHDFLLELQK